MSNKSDRNRAISVRIDMLNETQQDKLARGIKNLKKKIAPDARGTIIEGDMKSLPAKEPKLLDASDSNE